MAGRVLVVGSINTDLVVRSRTLPRPGETLIGESFFMVGGGKGANAAVAAARAGATVTLIGCLGNDDFGNARLKDLRREGIDVAHVTRVDDTPSGVALIIVDDAGENSIVVASGANARVSADALDRLAPGPGDVVLSQLEVPLPAIATAFQSARANGATTMLNAAPFHRDAASLLTLVDLIIVNEIEAGDLLGREAITGTNAEDAARSLLALGPDAVALTLGPQGAMVANQQERRLLPVLPVTVVDTTAAGDAFTGVLAAGLAAGRDLFAAAERAIRAGSLAVTKAGAQSSLPYLHEIEAGARA